MSVDKKREFHCATMFFLGFCFVCCFCRSQRPLIRNERCYHIYYHDLPLSIEHRTHRRRINDMQTHVYMWMWIGWRRNEVKNMRISFPDVRKMNESRQKLCSRKIYEASNELFIQIQFPSKVIYVPERKLPRIFHECTPEKRRAPELNSHNQCETFSLLSWQWKE